MIRFEQLLKLEECSLGIAGSVGIEDSLCLEKGLYRLACVKSGSGSVKFGTISERIKEKDVVLASADDELEFVSDENSCLELNLIGFNFNKNKYSEAFEKIATESKHGGLLVLFNDNISRLLENVSGEIGEKMSVYSAELLSLSCSQIFVYLLRSFMSLDEMKSKDDEINVKVCASVMEYIDEHIYSLKNLREVAHAIGYNYSYISTLFHKTCGITLNNYFKTKRMNEAKKLLSDSNVSISETARIMNYSSVYAFSKAFKEHFGSSPGHYTGRLATKE